MAIGAFILYVPAGRRTLETVSDAVSGGLVSKKMFELFGSGGFILAMSA